MSGRNDHGWELFGQTPDGGTVSFGRPVEARRRCDCARDICQREATQEDLLCDECRETCR